MQYKGYELDDFQEQAIKAIDRKHSVIVAAPTGAGKTLIAEYAIERYLEQGRRIIYTAPIKALSNQKFRDFRAQYGDGIGILTGDVVINPTAPALIMTTEILRNTLFDDPARLAQVEYVIFDEVHYINDIERGTVWEESILFAPPHIDFLCLSATIPNLEEFAGWMRAVRPQSTIEIVCETHRPVPLQHYLYIVGYGLASLEDLERLQQGIAHGGRPATRDVVDLLAEEGKLPCLYFCFSRRACEEKAEQHVDRNFLTASQQTQILALFDQLAQRFYVSHEPSAQRMRRLVSHGVAYHHAGILPTLKEVVEQLFTSGLLQLLFTTETFAVGVNMPACTVVFDSLEKYDGVNWRYLRTLEYHQMAGRAGRRGIDTVGYVYVQPDPQFANLEEIRRILTGQVEPVKSQFNLSYNSLLNLFHKYGLGLYQVCERSFNRYQGNTRRQEVVAALQRLEAWGQGLQPIECIYNRPHYIYEYARLNQRIAETQQELMPLHQQIRNSLSGRKLKRQRIRAVRELEKPLRRLQEQRARSKCHECPRQNQCLHRQHDLRRYSEERAHLLKEAEMLVSYNRVQIERRLQILQEFGYLDDIDLTVKGKVAAEIHGFEILLTELLFAEVFHQARETDINALVVAICYEPRLSERFGQPSLHLRHFLRDTQKIVAPFRRRERELLIEGTLPTLSFALTAAMEAWSEGASFATVQQLTNVAPGDVVRTFRHAIDLLRQVRRAVSGDPELQDKLGRCIRRINRDVVDAERQLRAGEHRPHSHEAELTIALQQEEQFTSRRLTAEDDKVEPPRAPAAATEPAFPLGNGEDEG